MRGKGEAIAEAPEATKTANRTAIGGANSISADIANPAPPQRPRQRPLKQHEEENAGTSSRQDNPPAKEDRVRMHVTPADGGGRQVCWRTEGK